MYAYNSYHKVITVALIVGWAIYQFSGSNSEESRVYPNGQVKVSGTHLNERNHGEWIWYYPDGTVQLQGSFDNGERTGNWSRFDENGQLIMHSIYLNNQMDGLCTEFDDKGNIIRQTEYQADTIIKRLSKEEFREPFKKN